MEEIRKDPIWYDFFYTELAIGLRKGEICGLMWSDFDSKQGTLSVRRTIHRRRSGGVTAGAKAEEALLIPVDFLSPASAGVAVP